ncbi:MAG: GGDEF domain-containing protein, partial [bacterium]
QQFKLIYRILDARGSPKWVLEQGRGIYNTQGELINLEGFITDITDRKKMEETLRELSLTDELTGLYNRRGFMTLAAQQLKIADRLKQELCLIYTDVDKMKWINDTLGHKEGDRALIETASVLRNTFRASDVIARIGGDEFVGLAIETLDKSHDMILNRLQENITAQNIHGTRSYQLSISVGIAQYKPDNPVTIEELLDQADREMYAQKRKKQYDT